MPQWQSQVQDTRCCATKALLMAGALMSEEGDVVGTSMPRYGGSLSEDSLADKQSAVNRFATFAKDNAVTRLVWKRIFRSPLH
ncbi:hypothetical protein MKX08_003445 [Trichoderma sp. CBMAI-0020]|nr:hypothetical protein MKX08_003445 [Trichoderma sp. CBMAI-0020]